MGTSNQPRPKGLQYIYINDSLVNHLIRLRTVNQGIKNRLAQQSHEYVVLQETIM